MPSVVNAASYPTDDMVVPRMEEADNYLASELSALLQQPASALSNT